MFPIMYVDLSDLVRNLLRPFIKQDILANLHEPSKKMIFLSECRLNVGFATELDPVLVNVFISFPLETSFLVFSVGIKWEHLPEMG